MKASFDSAAAVAYAYKYWSSYNTSYPDYSANGGGGDCANFVSQVFKAGGIRQKPIIHSPGQLPRDMLDILHIIPRTRKTKLCHSGSKMAT
uniref:amidase domain-containing protein n=1 Tax=Paenibacillus sp. FSL W8-0194 TaxID=2921711 RepID=UPI00403E71EB